MRVRELNEEVLFVDDQIVKVGGQDVKLLKEGAKRNQRERMRLCAHRSIDDRLHEMLIVLGKDTYIRPHKHLNKTESFHIIEGLANVVVFDENGNIIEVIRMGDYSSGRDFYYRISDPHYHTVLVRSDFLVFHETTNGPFDSSDTDFARWAPEEGDSATEEFQKQLEKAVEDFISVREEPS